MQLTTSRLLLRPPEPADAQAVFSRYASDPEVTRYVGWPRHQSIDAAHAFIAFSQAEWQRWPAGPLLICSRESGEVIGGTGFSFEARYRAMTGYVLARDMWGRGYATEALAAVVDLSQTLGLRRLYALCHVDHRPSWRVLEKSGFEREGRLRRAYEFPNLEPGEPQDVYCYARLF
jgi:RimJ/RimL family protein N-acetyltransferase